MEHTHIRLVALAPLALALTGCGVMKKLGLMHGPRAAKVQTALANTDSLTQIGRSQLDASNPGLAAKSFEQALATGERPAPALNGLGVAYARIGRADLAARYFQMAAEADPDNESYRANLAMLYQSTQMARLRSSQLQAAMAEAAKPADYAVPTAKEDGRIVRLSPLEVKIVIPPLEAQSPGAKSFVRIDLDKTSPRRKRVAEK
ncbi:tetratricopeptide repeat protein [Novosphingobium taihuense]|uniref:Tfp pilus assembly protein PilF n=2 Tax=Novosphingobium taihuense TaxID=260085 RepID=A0A7W7EXS4_9SPHN|nr:tetratricopeptide repeat protein [Novosphingobium taihuense]MBB4615650.1 Tfp pilus assembly protein PilF [Novosphingobium taihuense]TWH79582.1 tetratricopeptide repeat protein [Novosphingobium taihuense]